ncbi:hypothetical protein GCM10023187_01610 [Nibrella viscosa]|uniref:Uncharacterized protein n=1 Tax=Nibrella viscosa TaxID=1084524 RepID=A0ABP8JRX5_9BACT
MEDQRKDPPTQVSERDVDVPGENRGDTALNSSPTDATRQAIDPQQGPDTITDLITDENE